VNSCSTQLRYAKVALLGLLTLRDREGLSGQWGRCKGEECGSSGVQSRSVWCVHSDGWNTHHSNCQHSVKPDTQRPCFKVCEWHQDLFEWDVSEWSSCSLTLNSNDVRTRPLASECVTAQHGIQRRSVRCVRVLNGTSVSDRICEFFSPRPPLEQACLIPCPLDCVVSDFSSWSRCSGMCGVGLRHRTRHVLAAPEYGGAGCPELSETQPCEHQLPCPIGEDRNLYSLKVGAWSECRLPQQKDLLMNGRTTLDFGVKERNMTKPNKSFNKTNSNTTKPQTAKSTCKTKTIFNFRSKTIHKINITYFRNKTSKIRNCIQTKPKKSSKNLNTTFIKTTTRFINTNSPTTTNSIITRHTYTITFHKTAFTNSTINPSNSSTRPPGGGMWRSATRHGSLFKASVQVKGLCSGDDAPAASRPCLMLRDCHTSEWSSWSSCSKTCQSSDLSPGYRVRSRSVTQPSTGRGTECPALQEKEACNIIGDLLPKCPRYEWRSTDWSVCRITPLLSLQEKKVVNISALCGGGLQRRETYCVQVQDETTPRHGRDVSRPVCVNLCEETLMPSSVRSCFLPCSQSCLLSSWSSWGSCLPEDCNQGRRDGRRVKSV
ncbi:hypothetical protein QTP70_000819, partial [Hemibagrus guttatus]